MMVDMQTENPFASFATERLYLRPVTAADIPAYEKHFIDYEIIRNLSGTVPWPYPKDGVRDFIERIILPTQGKERWVWGLFLKTNPDELIGALDLWREGKPEHRGFWLARLHQGQGLMTEAVAPVMDYAFEALGFEKLIFTNALGNRKSRRIKEKTGARFLGTSPAKYVDPDLTERELWEITAQEWRDLRSA